MWTCLIILLPSYPKTQPLMATGCNQFTLVESTDKLLSLGHMTIIISINSLIAQLVNNLPAVQATSVRFLGWEDPLEKGKATHSSILAWRIPLTEKSMGSERVGHKLSDLHFNSKVKMLQRTKYTAFHQWTKFFYIKFLFQISPPIFKIAYNQHYL